jgi:hypothetical protein
MQSRQANYGSVCALLLCRRRGKAEGSDEPLVLDAKVPSDVGVSLSAKKLEREYSIWRSPIA